MRLLNEALDQSERAGLTQHPIRARTFVTLGIVSLGGFKQRDQAVKYFRKALQIQPEVRLSPGLANPDIQAAFDEAIAGLSTAGWRRSAAGEGAGSRARAGGTGRQAGADPRRARQRSGRELGGAALPGVDGLLVHGPDDEEGLVGRASRRPSRRRRRPGSMWRISSKPAGPTARCWWVAAPRRIRSSSRWPGRRRRSRRRRRHRAPRPAASDKRLFFAILGGTGFGWASGTGEATLGKVASPGVDWTQSWGRWRRRSATWSRRGS